MDQSPPQKTNISKFDPKRVLVIVGPTGSGKTSLCFSLAQQIQMPIEIVCMDSMQIYAECRIGTTRPTEEEEKIVPHHLFGAFSIQENMSSARYSEQASSIIAQIQARGRLPVLIGGTGLYMRALFEGLDAIPATPAALRERLEKLVQKKGKTHLYQLLKRLDPQAAAKLHVNDRQRVMRFLEVRLMTGQSMLSLWGNQENNREHPIVIGLQVERSLLVNRIEQRVPRMLEAGWLAEVKSMEENGLIDLILDLGPLGYRQIFEYLASRQTYEKMVENIVVETRRYAKRQMTWFRKVTYIQWFPLDPKTGYNEKGIVAFINEKLG